MTSMVSSRAQQQAKQLKQGIAADLQALTRTLCFLCIVCFANLVLPSKGLAKDVLRFQQGLKSGEIPRASTRSIVPITSLNQCPNKCKTLGDTATAFSDSLRKAGYSQQAWFLIDNPYREGTGALAIVLTELESIHSDGRPRTSRRWATGFASPDLKSFQDIIKSALVGAPPGRYRSFLFAFTTPDSMIMQSLPSWHGLGEVMDAVRHGNRVPVVSSLEKVKSGGYRCYVYIYEFERSPVDGSVRFLEESSLTAQQHLKGAGIWPLLGLR